MSNTQTKEIHMQKLDPTTWPKVEGTYSTTGVYWHVCHDGCVVALFKYAGVPVDVRYAAIYGPIEFATNDAPETVTLYEVSSEKWLDGKHWVIKDDDGYFTPFSDGDMLICQDDATVHRTQTYTRAK